MRTCKRGKSAKFRARNSPCGRISLRQCADFAERVMRLVRQRLPDLPGPQRIMFREDGIWGVVCVEGSDMASRSVAHVQVRVTNPLSSFTNVANARLAEKIAERIAHHAAIDPAGWEAFAAAEIKLALDAAARSPQ
jgi:hypothetical protein